MATTKIAKIPFSRLLYAGVLDNSKKKQTIAQAYTELCNKYPNKEVYVANGGFFDGTVTSVTPWKSSLGLKSGGVVLDSRFSLECFMAFCNNKVEYYPPENNCPITMKDAIAGHPALLENGKQAASFRYCIDKSDRGRTLLGYDNNNFVIVCVQDTSGTSDLTLDECVKTMQKQGCKYAINLDGGGSSQCVFNGSQIYSTRKVHNFIYAIAEPDNSTPEKQYQTWLNETYNFGLAVDGSLGPATNKAQIKAMQTENGSGVDGSWGPASQREHKSFTMGSVYATKSRVKILQGALCRKGMWQENIDGVFDEALLDTLRLYQKKNGLAVDGWAGPATFTALFK